MIKDIEMANTIGGLVEQLLKSKERRESYSMLGKQANLYCTEFMVNAQKVLEEEKGIIKVIIDWAVGLLPGWVTKISESSLKVVQEILIENLEQARFDSWDDILTMSR